MVCTICLGIYNLQRKKYNIIWILTCDPLMYKIDHAHLIVSNQKEEFIVIERVDPFQTNGIYHKATYNRQNDPLYILRVTNYNFKKKIVFLCKSVS